MSAQHKQLAALHINDHYDTTSLAQEHLENAEALFSSVCLMLKNYDPERAHKVARMGYEQAGKAIDDFHAQLQILDARDAENG